MAMTVTHYHTHDLVSGDQHTHAAAKELEGYLSGTGEEMMQTRGCSSSACAPEDSTEAAYGED